MGARAIGSDSSAASVGDFGNAKVVVQARIGQMDIAAAATALQKFAGASLTAELSRIESSLKGASKAASLASLSGDEKQALTAAASLKRIAAKVNSAIHALGIMLCLPHLLTRNC